MRFILQVKPEFRDRLQEIAQKYVDMGVEHVSVIQTFGIVAGETDSLTFEQLSDNEWMASIQENGDIQAY